MTKQQRKVYEYIRDHAGCTTKEIMMSTGIQCPSGRISELRRDGVDIISVGQVKYEGSKAFEKYQIGTPLTKTVSRFVPSNGGMREIKEEVII